MLKHETDNKGAERYLVDLTPRPENLSEQAKAFMADVTVVIPVALRRSAHDRARNLFFTYQVLKAWGFDDIVLAVQPMRYGIKIPGYIQKDPAVRIVELPRDNKVTMVQKAKLMNAATPLLQRTWMWQLDMDIALDMEDVLERLAKEARDVSKVITPYPYFRHLYEEDTATLSKTYKLEIPFWGLNVANVGAGSFLVPVEAFKKVQYNEKYEGWGYEDDDIALRFEQAGYTSVRLSKTMGLHLHHPDDRQFNRQNLRTIEEHVNLPSSVKELTELEMMEATCSKHKFVIVCHPRTGSTLLGRTLNDHPEIHSYPGEIFGLANGPRARLLPKEPMDIDQVYQFIHSTILNTPKAITGLRLHWNHPPKQLQAWGFDSTALHEEISTWDEFRMLHLYRRNVIDWCVSARLAVEYSYFNEPYEDKQQIRIPVSRFTQMARRYVEEVRNWSEFYDKHKGPKTIVVYEDLVANWGEELPRIQRFLGVETVEQLEPATDEQRRQPVSAYIENIDELVEALQTDSSLQDLPYGLNITETKHQRRTQNEPRKRHTPIHKRDLDSSLRGRGREKNA